MIFESVTRGEIPPVYTTLKFGNYADTVELYALFACARLSESYLPQSNAASFPQRSPPWLLATATRGGLKPLPVQRLRGAYPHLMRDFLAHYVKINVACLIVNNFLPLNQKRVNLSVAGP
jgi:hypothetical protein